MDISNHTYANISLISLWVLRPFLSFSIACREVVVLGMLEVLLIVY